MKTFEFSGLAEADHVRCIGGGIREPKSHEILM